MNSFYFNLLLFFFLSSTTWAHNTITLDQIYTQALTLETKQTSQAMVKQFEAQFDQAKGSIFPQISLVASQQYQKSEYAYSRTNLSSQNSAALQAQWTFFQGLKEFDVYKQGRENLNYWQKKDHSTDLQIYQTVVQQFFLVYTQLKDFQNLKQQQKLAEDLADETKAWYKVGRSKESDYLASLAQVETAKALAASAEALYLSSKKQFFLLYKIPDDSNFDFQKTSIKLSNLQFYLDKLVATHPDLQAEEHKLKANDAAISATKANYFPRLSLVTNYYLDRPTISKTEWDITLNLTLPLFEGGATSAQVTEQRWIKTQTMQESTLMQRTLRSTLEQGYLTLQLGLVQEQDLQKSHNTFKKSYQAVKRDYKSGLATSLDVTQALTQLTQHQRTLDQIILQNQSNYLLLLALSGQK